jgi:hypothetical protein
MRWFNHFDCRCRFWVFGAVVPTSSQKCRVHTISSGAGEEVRGGSRIHFTTFSDKWSKFDEELWPRSWSNRKDNGRLAALGRLVEVLGFGSSTMIDRMLALLFVVFWFVLFLV